MKFVIINTGVGNVKSVANMLKRTKVEALISDDSADILTADALILPGVGSYDAALKRFKKLGLVDVLNEKVLAARTPIMGLCLGMQLMATGSEEGDEPGFNWIPGILKKISPIGDKQELVRVPHMGWNIVRDIEGCVLYENMGNEPRFYFDHSYYLQPDNEDHYYGAVYYGSKFAAGIQRNNIFGLQFHPEKSHRFGLEMFRNFVNYASGARDSSVR